jgi:hypothetical protein
MLALECSNTCAILTLATPSGEQISFENTNLFDTTNPLKQLTSSDLQNVYLMKGQQLTADIVLLNNLLTRGNTNSIITTQNDTKDNTDAKA